MTIQIHESHEREDPGSGGRKKLVVRERNPLKNKRLNAARRESVVEGVKAEERVVTNGLVVRCKRGQISGDENIDREDTCKWQQ